MNGLNDLEALPPRQELIERWEELMGKPPPPRISNVRLYRSIRYAEQVAADPQAQHKPTFGNSIKTLGSHSDH